MRTIFRTVIIPTTVWIGLSLVSHSEELMAFETELDGGVLISFIDSRISTDWNLNQKNLREREVSPLVAVSAAKDFVSKNLKSIDVRVDRVQLREELIQGKSYWIWSVMFDRKGAPEQDLAPIWIRVSREGNVMARFVPAKKRLKK